MKRIKPKAEYSLEIEGETIMSEAPKKLKIIPKADYSVDTTKGNH